MFERFHEYKYWRLQLEETGSGETVEWPSGEKAKVDFAFSYWKFRQFLYKLIKNYCDMVDSYINKWLLSTQTLMAVSYCTVCQHDHWEKFVSVLPKDSTTCGQEAVRIGPPVVLLVADQLHLLNHRAPGHNGSTTVLCQLCLKWLTATLQQAASAEIFIMDQFSMYTKNLCVSVADFAMIWQFGS